MRDKTATAIIKYKAHDGTWKRAPVISGKNGSVKVGYALIQRMAKPVDAYRYEIRYYEGRKVKYESVGDPTRPGDRKPGVTSGEIEAARLRRQKKSSLLAAAEELGIRVPANEQRKTLRSAAVEYIEDAVARGAMEAAAQARNVTDEFRQVVMKTFVDEITRKDILVFHACLRTRGCSDRTVSNKHARLKSWLLFSGIDREVLPPAPEYEKRLPTIYTAQEIESLLKAARPVQRMCVLLAYRCGLRDQELQYAEFHDIDWTRKTFRVQGKDKWGFRVKDKEQRDVPIPDDLFEELRAWREKNPRETLILPTSNHAPNSKLLLSLKGVARRASLNCQRCDGCKSHRRECENFTLHKFRRTYLTTLLRNGIDLKTCQALAGHSDLASTMRYLRPAENTELRAKINQVRW